MTKKSKKEGEAFHFITYIPFKGKLYELDGLQEGPILLGDCNGENWFEGARDEINKRIMKYATNEIRFSLLAVVGSKQEQYEKEVKRINSLRGNLYKKLKDLGETITAEEEELISGASSMVEESEIPATAEGIHAKLAELTVELQNNKELLQDETLKYKRYEDENARRKHNYLPFILEMLKMVAKKGKLNDLVQNAKEKQAARLKAKEDRKKEEKK